MNGPERCPICHAILSEENAINPLGNDFRYLPCPECGLLTMSPLPDSAQIKGFYSAASYGMGRHKFPGWLEWIRDHSQRRRAAWVHRRGGRVLDIGCGSGVFLRCMAALGHSIYGTELPGPAAERARCVPGLDLRLGDLREDSFPQGYFDAITLWHVLEHLSDPERILGLCRGLLRPSGQLFLEAPNLDSWQARLFGRHWLHLDPPRHLHQFTTRALETLLRNSGFEVEERSTFSLAMGWMGALQSGSNALMPKRDLFYRLLLTRGRSQDSVLEKVSALAAAALLAPPALVFCLVEASAGHGAVLRYRCRPAFG